MTMATAMAVTAVARSRRGDARVFRAASVGAALLGLMLGPMLGPMFGPMSGPFVAPAHAQPQTPGPESRAQTLQRLLGALTTHLTQATRALVGTQTPPQPVAVRWQARRISSVDLGAPLLALESADLDGDRRAEIIALTTRELVIVERESRRKLTVRARASLPPELPALTPRAPVGTMTVADSDGDGRLEVSARSSSRARGGVYQYRAGALVEVARIAGFPLCGDAFAELEPGRNYFAKAARRGVAGNAAQTPARALPRPEQDAPASSTPAGYVSVLDRAFVHELPRPFFNARCRRDLVDPAGRRVSAVAIVAGDSTLHLFAQRSCPPGDEPCRQDRTSARKLADKGATFALTDIDNDGHPEVAVSAASAPGEADRVTVLSWRGERVTQLFQRSFSGGIVGLTAGDIDGDNALELLAAVRLWGSRRVDMWVLNR